MHETEAVDSFAFSTPLRKAPGYSFYFIEIPERVSRAIGRRGPVPVVSTINGKTEFRASIVPVGGGRHRLQLNARVRSEVGIEPGDRLTAVLRVDKMPQADRVPHDLDRALRDSGALEAFGTFPAGKRSHIIRWIEEAVGERTREKRIAKGVEVSLLQAEAAYDKQASGSTAPRSKERFVAPRKAIETGIPVVSFADAKEWSAWLASSHASSRGVWLKIAKKTSTNTSVTYAEAIEVALVWGWIDGQKKAFDEAWWLQKFTPRGSKSVWSKINRDKAIALMAAGKMMPFGLAEVERAKKDGRWDRAYESQRDASVPEDLATALANNPRAQRCFATLEAHNRYAILWRVHNAKKAETRARRIAQFVAMLAKGEKLHP
jgi:uncharacterized protein YdeI (YjbR/CyaY-like superfamily)